MKFLIPSKKIRAFHQLQQVDYASIPDQKKEEVREKLKNLTHAEPLVSVVLIAYNEEQNLFGCLASLSETVINAPIEIIVVNNASTDGTAKVIEDTGLRAVYEEKKGYGFARQRGLIEAKGKIVITGDADTLYLPTWVAAMSEPFDDAGVACAYSLHALLSDNNKYSAGLLTYQWFKMISWMLKHRKRPQLNCGGASMSYRKEDALKLGGYKADDARWEDGYMAYSLKDLGKIKMVGSKRAVIYTSMRRVRSDGSLLKAFLKRFNYRLRHLDSFMSSQSD